MFLVKMKICCYGIIFTIFTINNDIINTIACFVNNISRYNQSHSSLCSFGKNQKSNQIKIHKSSQSDLWKLPKRQEDASNETPS